MHVLVGSDGVDRPAALLRQEEGLEGRAKDRATGLTASIALATPDHDNRAEQQHAGRQCVRQPESNISLGPDHTDLSSQGTGVDGEVEPVVDALCGDGWVNDDAFARLERLNVDMLFTELLDDERVDVRLETTSTKTNDQNLQRQLPVRIHIET